MRNIPLRWRVDVALAVGAALLLLAGVVAGGSSVGVASADRSAVAAPAGDRIPATLTPTPPEPVTVPAAGAPRPVPANSTVGSAAPIRRYDEIQIGIDVRRNATARWTVEFRYRLDESASRTAFNRTAENVSGTPVVFLDNLDRWAVSDAREATGRSMELRGGTAETDKTVSGSVGIVRYRFLWTNFARRQDDDRLVVEDTIGAVDFERQTSVAIHWPDALRRESVSPAPDYAEGNVVRWDPPLRFQATTPRVELVVTEPLDRGGLPLVPIAALGLLVVVGVVGGWYARSRWRDSREAATAADEGGDETPATPPEELLTDEERVLHLIEENGGRMKQQDLIEAVEWSRTKASDVVNAMHEAERIEVYRLGRENVLALPGEIEI